MGAERNETTDTVDAEGKEAAGVLGAEKWRRVGTIVGERNISAGMGMGVQ